ncbi:MAG: class I SAM-dependent methyltransferase [Flammeovirgaceae bacterium]
MKRLHLFEFEDKAWYPDFIRKGQTDFLRWLMQTFNVFKAVMPLFKKALAQLPSQPVVDLCSGGGGSILLVRNYLEKDGLAPQFILTDLFPNVEAFKLLQQKTAGQVGYLTESVDARQLPDSLQGFFTLFNGFHHFQPQEAQQVLAQLIQRKAGIAIFEPIEKSVFQFLLNTFAIPLLQLLFTPFILPFRWDRLLFTYLIPIIPICTLWDGWVSVLRLYTPKEMLAMAQSLSADYEWQAGTARHTFGVVTYLIGIPKDAK